MVRVAVMEVKVIVVMAVIIIIEVVIVVVGRVIVVVGGWLVDFVDGFFRFFFEDVIGFGCSIPNDFIFVFEILDAVPCGLR